MGIRVKLVIASVMLVAGATVGHSGVAQAEDELPLETHACGDNIDHSFRLNNDLLGCPGDGLNVGASGVIIDLNGHRVEGVRGGTQAGIDNSGANEYDDLHVINGVVKAFADGVVSGGARTQLVGLTIAGNVNDGAQLLGDEGSVSDTVVAGNGDRGVYIAGGKATVSAVAVTNNSTGIVLESTATGARVLESVISGNRQSGVLVGGDQNTVADNRLDGNGDASTVPGLLATAEAKDNIISGNLIHGSGDDGYRDDGDSNLAYANTARGNGFAGGADGVGTGIDASAATNPDGSQNISIGNDNGAVPCTPAALCTSPPSETSKLPLEFHSCGDTITQSFRLANNLTNCPEDGLVVKRDNITIDLNGHRIVGNGEQFNSGILVTGTASDPRLTGVVIKNGVVKDFGDGVFANSRGPIKLTNLTISGNTQTGVRLHFTPAIVKNNVFAGNYGEEGLEIGSSGSVVSANTFAANGDGLQLGDGVRVSKNWFGGNVDNAILVDGNRNKIIRNTFDGNGELHPGVYLRTASKNVFSRNVIRGSGADAYEDDSGPSNVVSRNVARGNGYGGTPDGSRGGFDASEATDPKGSKNVASGNDNTAAPCAPASLCN